MSSDGAFLAAAAAIGDRIVADAVWDHGRCNWVGGVPDPVLPRYAESRALGPDLYGGTAGVGLFLAQLFAVTGDAPVRRAGVGALRHAVARAESPTSARHDGFHAGPVGVAWAAARAAALLGEEELDTRARFVLSAAPKPSQIGRCPDIAMGAAGSIVGLLALAATFESPRLVEEALVAGDALIDSATVTRRGWSWAIPGRRWPHHLCGLSHGAAGIGSALLELFAATGEERFRVGAEAAFAYERSWLDPSSGTWPDLRTGGRRHDGMRAIASPMTGTWCHGEAGIALTRLRGSAVLGGGPCASDAEAAIETTRRHLAGALPYAFDDLSLCHGLAGSADALLCATAGDVAADFGRAALERTAAAIEDWPCGIEGGTTPGLFLGLSGIAWLLLRLHDDTIASPSALPIHS